MKYFQPGFEKTLANEWVSYCLARYLGLPIPFARLVEIPQEFSLQLSRTCSNDSYTVSICLPLCTELLWMDIRFTDVPNITNREQSLADIILFDYWMCNGDRTRKNILLRDDTPNSYQLWTIDHAEIFAIL